MSLALIDAGDTKGLTFERSISVSLVKEYRSLGPAGSLALIEVVNPSDANGVLGEYARLFGFPVSTPPQRVRGPPSDHPVKAQLLQKVRWMLPDGDCRTATLRPLGVTPSNGLYSLGFYGRYHSG